MNPEISINDVVQINPESDLVFGGCFMQVTHVKSWGLRGFVMVPGRGEAHYSINHGTYERIGSAVWKADEKVGQ